MTTHNRSALQIAHEALLHIESAKSALNQLESMLFAVTMLKDHPAHAKNLISAAWYLATDNANATDGSYESIHDALDDLAPQNAQSENVARNSEGKP